MKHALGTLNRRRATYICILLVSSIPCSTVASPFAVNSSEPEGCDGVVEHESPDPSGAKGELVKQATKLLATAIRRGGHEAAKILKYLDKDAAKAFKKHSGTIARHLDRIAKIPDLTTRIVKEKLYNGLRNGVGLNGGTALQIADAVKAVIDWLVL